MTFPKPGIALAWAALLASLATSPARPLRAQADQGRTLAVALGCGACHAGLPGPGGAQARAPVLGADPLPAEFVFQYLADPQPRRPEIAPARMPDFRLREDERLALALYLGSEEGESLEVVRGSHRDITAADGERLYRGLGCGGCHGEPGRGTSVTAPALAAPVGPDLSTAGARYRREWVASYLASPVPVRPAGHRPGTGSRMPDFRLSPDEAAALTAYLASLGAGGPESRGSADSPGTPTAWARERAESYLADRLSCLGCHGWRGEGGRLAPPLDGLRDRLTPGAVAAAVHDPAMARPGSVMPPSRFRREILERVVALLVADTVAWVPALAPEIRWEERRVFLEEAARSAGSPGGGQSREGGIPEGRHLYLATCAQCHGTRGDGRGFNAPYLPAGPTAHADAAAMSLRPDDTLHDGIASGGWVLDRSHRMPAFGGRLTSPQIRSLVAYIRELCGCGGPGWSRGGTP